jgi:hypothetical protein
MLSCNMNQNLQLGAVYRKEISAALRDSELGLSKPGHLVRLWEVWATHSTEHTGFCELYAADAGDATAEFVADCLVQWSLRWGFPETAWGGQNVQMSGEVIARVCARLGIKCMSSTAYNKNAIAKQERKHKLINSAQQEHTQQDAIGGQGGHSAKRPDWACKPNHFPVSVAKREFSHFCSSIFHSPSAIMATRCRRSRQAAPRGQPRCSPNA